MVIGYDSDLSKNLFCFSKISGPVLIPKACGWSQATNIVTTADYTVQICKPWDTVGATGLARPWQTY